MPLRDHFRPPLDNMRQWEGFHATWPAMIIVDLQERLPARYFAEPRVHTGASAGIDVATFEEEGERPWPDEGNGAGGVATAVWAPPRSTFSVACDLPAQDVYEVRVYDEKRRRRLVAAVEIVSPGNKDRPEFRNAFVAKCAGLLRERVSVVIVDVVTTRTSNLYVQLLDLLGLADPGVSPDPPPLYTAACRMTRPGGEWTLESWVQPLSLAQPLPTAPLWLADDLAVPLDLEGSYQRSCKALKIP